MRAIAMSRRLIVTPLVWSSLVSLVLASGPATGRAAEVVRLRRWEEPATLIPNSDPGPSYFIASTEAINALLGAHAPSYNPRAGCSDEFLLEEPRQPALGLTLIPAEPDRSGRVTVLIDRAGMSAAGLSVDAPVTVGLSLGDEAPTPGDPRVVSNIVPLNWRSP